MLSDEQCAGFRPLGDRLLVKRSGLQDQSKGGIHVLGRDFPTLGRVVRVSSKQFEGDNEISEGDEVQWAIKPDFDQRCVIGPDWLCLEVGDINMRIDQHGVAKAIGNRVLVSPLPSDGLLTRETTILLKAEYKTRWALGRIVSAGKTTIFTDEGAYVDAQIIYNPSFRSELRLNNQQYFVVRDEDCIATVED